MIYRLLIVILFVSSIPASAQEMGFPAAVQAYQNQDFEKARDGFMSLAETHPNNPTLLYNLGLAEYQRGQFGLALGLWRKALSFTPHDSALLAAVEYTEDQLFPNQDEQSFLGRLYEYLTALPLNVYLFIAFACLLASGWLLVDFVAKRKLPLGQWPGYFYFSLFVFLVSALISSSIIVDRQQIRATVISKDVQLRTNPSESAPTLSDLTEGELVKVESVTGSWARIRTQSGAPGWLLTDHLIIFGG